MGLVIQEIRKILSYKRECSSLDGALPMDSKSGFNELILISSLSGGQYYNAIDFSLSYAY